MSELIPISAVVGDRTYRIRIEPADEEVVRKTLKMLNDKIIEYKTEFAGKDMQDYIAMVLIWLATEHQEEGAMNVEKETVAEQLKLLEKLIDNR